MPMPEGVIRKQIVRGRKGVFILCDDSTNGRIYFRRDGTRGWKRFRGPESPHKRLSLTIGKRGLFILCGDGRSGSLFFRSFGKDKPWRRYQGPRPTATGR